MLVIKVTDPDEPVPFWHHLHKERSYFFAFEYVLYMSHFELCISATRCI